MACLFISILIKSTSLFYCMMPQESGISPPAPLTTPRLAAHSPIRYTKVLFSAQTPKSSDNKMLHAYIIFQSFFKHPPKPHVLHPNTYSRPILTPSSSFHPAPHRTSARHYCTLTEKSVILHPIFETPGTAHKSRPRSHRQTDATQIHKAARSPALQAIQP